MDGPRRIGPKPTEQVGTGSPWRPSLGYLAAALGIVAGGLVVLSISHPSPAPAVRDAAPQTTLLAVAASPSTPAAAGRVVAATSNPAPPAPLTATAMVQSPAPAAGQQIPRMRDPNGDLTPDISDFVNSGETPTMAEVIDRLHLAGVQTGLGAFNKPGTRPPRIGLAVPEDFVLPEGYVRHYQATDDGQRIEPILMFSPDRPLLDANQRPIAIPADRVVPPELAPPGLPLRRVVIPAPAEPGRPGR